MQLHSYCQIQLSCMCCYLLTLDMLVSRMYEHGHTVVGVEFVEQPVKELFTDNTIEFDVTAITDVGNLYKVTLAKPVQRIVCIGR